jgi:hypothetical protein
MVEKIKKLIADFINENRKKSLIVKDARIRG